MEEKVIVFVARECGRDSADVTLSSDLGKDFGIAGDDGAELMRNYAREFGVDLTGFEPDDYFGREIGFFPVAIIFPSWWKAKRNRRVLTVGDLVEMAKRRSWLSFLNSK